MSDPVCPPDHAHGQNATCRSVHGCKCDDCREYGRLYEYWRAAQHKAGRPLVIDSTGTIRRIRALQALGWSHEAISASAGHSPAWSSLICRRPRVKPATAAKIARVYDELSMRIPVATTPAEAGWIIRNRNHAKQMGWLPPLAYDDDAIDLPEHSETHDTNERKAAA
ncbi:helix-turn-helix transcriptional regulator [Microbacterium esteraromaticum]|uniref:helix-turn-helix domain-containing protein n=1 Tax=Microbacterium esteraromaticum TaxID=57043 RepID=UPI002368E2E2|nr:helix-turn-helix transcriptional regulator [Microbacterium esteraromaticum]WDH77894.1 helix-turn-helix transcriptional regulator [Microbacterium esteraromaticum]